MAQIGVFDIVGPIMVGPSSSHTAGAVRLGLAATRILGEPVREADISLHGSFAATYWGHRTDVALLAGLLGMRMSDARIPQAKQIAAEKGLNYTFQTADLGDVHPNSVYMKVKGTEGKIDIQGASIGGGRVKIYNLDGFEISIDGAYNVLMARYKDEPGIVADVTRILANYRLNIAFMEVSRKIRGSGALLVAEIDDPIPGAVLDDIRELRTAMMVRTLPCF